MNYILTPNAAALFFLMISETDNGKQPFSIPQRGIADALGITRHQAQKAIDELKKNGYIKAKEKNEVQPETQPNPQPRFQPRDDFVINWELIKCAAPIPKTKPLFQPETQPESQPMSETEKIKQSWKGIENPQNDLEQKYNNWCSYCLEHTPFLCSNIMNMSVNAFAKLRDKYGVTVMASVIMQIENRKDLRKKYCNLYLTLNNWCKNDLKRREQ